MKLAYKVMAYLIAVEVAVQAAMIVLADAGLSKYVEQGGVFDKATMESDASPFPEIVGFMIHGINGMMVIPVAALLLLIFSFFTKVPGAVKAAGLVLLLVVVQIALGILGHDVSALGAVHGLNALLLFATALYAARRDRAAQAVAARPRAGAYS
ncbi:hypothetical protein Skr01_43700 [Sphaerisporangium krabiense]|uniref:Heme A synthase n=1 Tax=Sphaerisporangium krabiense TaxID=763782 RepID=A0A7W9DNA3_9ACTN|nr:hypothetical protein [Sphaerisporangium krabiense]MBB5625206.1 heme A synthase [Sphaerisporangium krabiense]GII64285.1 hypothetical protein Skr01_43700 [Sphaerisporangium krabiense]